MKYLQIKMKRNESKKERKRPKFQAKHCNDRVMISLNRRDLKDLRNIFFSIYTGSKPIYL